MTDLPEKVDLSDSMPPVGDQGELGSSSAFAVVSALRHLESQKSTPREFAYSTVTEISRISVTVDRLSPDTSMWAAFLYGPGGRATLHCSSDQKSVIRTAEEVSRVLSVSLKLPE